MAGCCGAARRAREQATSLQVAAQQDAERQAQRRADDLALSDVVKVAAESAVAEAAQAPKTRKRRVRVTTTDDE